MRTLSAHSTVQRYQSLDCIRGFAAASVMIAHFFGNQIASHPILNELPTKIFYASHNAVIVFFVLSGFALFLLLDSRKTTYGSFIASRFLRIYPTYIFSILFALILTVLVNVIHPRAWEPRPITLNNVFEHLLLIGPIDFAPINGVIWTLVHEMRISLFFPVIYLAVKKNAPLSVASATVVSILIGISHFGQPFSTNFTELVSLTGTIHYTTLFVYGAAIANYRQQILYKLNELPNSYRWIFILFSVAGYTYTEADLANVGRGWILDIYVGIFSSGIIAMAIAISLDKMKALQYVGKISFSLYLIHLPIGIFFLKLFKASNFSLELAIASTLVSVITADAVYRLVEKKSLEWSRSAKLNPANQIGSN